MTARSTTAAKRKSPFGLFGRWWQDLKRRRAAVAELDRCGGAEVDEMARDIGLSSVNLRSLAGRRSETVDLLRRRMAAIGLDEAQLAHDQPPVMRDLQRVCAGCGDPGRCRRDLDRNGDDTAWRDYCPNVVTLDALQGERETTRLIGRRRKWRSF